MTEHESSEQEKSMVLEQRAEILREKYEQFLNHQCPLVYCGAIGGKITYSFTSTSLGTVCKATCACGHKEDLSDYQQW